MFRKLTRIFVVSHAVDKVLIEHKIENTEVLHNGIQIENTVLDEVHEEAFRAKYSLTNKRVILFGGRISNAKGIGSAIETLNRLKDEYNDLVLLVVGKEDSIHDSVYSLLNKYNLKDRVIFTGWIDSIGMKIAMRISEFVLVLSLYLDPFPTINLESFREKKPVIATKYGGSPEIVKNNINGFVVNPYDYDEVAGKCRLLLNDHAMIEALGQNGYCDVIENFSESKHIKYLESCYNRAYVFTE
jgi:glycosyltransferase involved in cell wall biosynthesis